MHIKSLIRNLMIKVVTTLDILYMDSYCI